MQRKLKFLKVRGKAIVDEAGRPVRLKGVNLGGWLMMEGYILGGRNIPQYEFIKKLKRKIGKDEAEKFIWRFRDSFIQESDIENIRDLGFNCVRIPIHYRLIEEAPYRYSKDGLRYLDKVLAWFDRYKIYCILDLHAAPGAQNRDWHSDSKGRALLWEKGTYQDRCVELWQILADRYSERKCIAGYDLLNESVTANVKLNKLYRRVTEAIRSCDKNHIIFLEGNRWAQYLDGLWPPYDSNTAYSIHFYNPIDFTFNFRPGLDYPGNINGERWNRSKLNRCLNLYTKFRDRYSVPIFVGEFGISSRCILRGPGLRWLEDILALFNELDFHWAYWTYKAVAGDKFPDGIYQFLDNESGTSKGTVMSGWEKFWWLPKAQRDDALRSLKTQNFMKLEALSKMIKKGK